MFYAIYILFAYVFIYNNNIHIKYINTMYNILLIWDI